MNKLDNIVNNQIIFESFSYGYFIILAIICAIVSMCIGYHFKILYPNVIKSQHFTQTLIGVAVITFLIIVTIKNSLALSLGLIGALSIVRFRTPIKEPFELCYIFAAIATGIGLGAGQILNTTTVIIIYLIVLSILSNNKLWKNEGGVSIFIKYNKGTKDNVIEKLAEINKEKNVIIDVKRVEKTENSVHYSLNIKSSDKDIQFLSNEICLNLLKPDEFSIIDNNKSLPL